MLAALSLLYRGALALWHPNPDPFGLHLLLSADIHWDFEVFEPRFQRFGTPAFWTLDDYPFTYPAPLVLVFAALYRMPHPLFAYELLLIAAVAAGAIALARQMTVQGIAAGWAAAFTASTLLMAWPLWALLFSANIEGVVAIVLAAGVLACLRRRWWLGCALIAIAGAMKIFPLALLGLAVSQKKYSQTAFGLLLALLVTLASLRAVGPTVKDANAHVQAGLAFVNRNYVLPFSLPTIENSHSPFQSVKLCVVSAHHWLHPREAVGDPSKFAAHVDTLKRKALIVYMFAICSFGIVGFFGRVRTLPMLNQLLWLTACAVVLPPYSADYTLIQTFVPFAMLCLYATHLWHYGRHVPGLPLCMGSFAFVFTVGSFFTIRVPFSSQVRAAALCLLLYATMRYALKWNVLDNPIRRDHFA